MKLVRKILFATCAPLVGVALVSGVLIQESVTRLAESNILLTSIDRAPVFDALAHELQKERGLSAGLIGAKGGEFTPLLHTQRNMTDAAREDLAALLPMLGAEPELGAIAVRIEERLAKLTSARREVNDFTASVSQMASFYTPLIGDLLTVASRSMQAGNVGQIARQGIVYAAILQAKERAGIQRAMGANGFGNGTFAPAIYKRFLELGAAQVAYLDIARSVASDDTRQDINEILSGPVIEDFDALRTIAGNSVFDGTLQGVSGPQWFKVSTARINLFKTLGDEIAAKLGETACKIHDQTLAEVFWWSGSLGLLTLVCLGAMPESW